MTDRHALEQEILDLSIQLVEAKYAVEEALIRQEWARKVKQLVKEQREKKAKES